MAIIDQIDLLILKIEPVGQQPTLFRRSDFRNDPLLAQPFAAIDHLSIKRLLLGIFIHHQDIF